MGRELSLIRCQQAHASFDNILFNKFCIMITMMIMMMQLMNQKKFQREHDYGGQGVGGATSAPNPFDDSSLPDGLLEPLTSQLMNSKNGGGLLPSPMEHLSKDPGGKWKMEILSKHLFMD